MQAVDEANEKAAREDTMRSEAAFEAKVQLDRGARWGHPLAGCGQSCVLYAVGDSPSPVLPRAHSTSSSPGACLAWSSASLISQPADRLLVKHQEVAHEAA